MPAKTIGIEMNLGYEGNYARTPDCIIMARKAAAAIGFGMPVILNTDNTWAPFGGSNTAAQFAGVAVREVKQATNYADQNHVGYAAGDPCDVLERGNIVVKCGKGDPTAGGKVYIRKALNDSYPDQVIGSFEAAADSTNTVELTNAYWTTGKKDSHGMAEITIKYKA